jgi:pyruvate/2-oxoglutarate dehydrogenase complex dihydrolipoamide dehydrogenase (E3) component
VTLLEMMPQFLSREDPDAAKILERNMRRDGVDIRLNTKLSKVSVDGGEKRVAVTSDGEEQILSTDEILVGVGRIPNVEDLGLEAAGVQFDLRSGVRVNDRLQTANPRIYAAGDVVLTHKFTHTADAAARLVVQNALFLGRKKISRLTIPWCTYTSPEVAHVGMYERDAVDKGLSVSTITVPLDAVDRAVLDGSDDGFVRIHLKEGTDEILGATIVANHAGDLISEITLAMVEGIGLGKISSVIHPYPTQAEGIRKAADAYNRTRLTPFVKNLFARWFSWTR